MKIMVIIGDDEVVDGVARNIEKAYDLGPTEVGLYEVRDAWDDQDPSYQMKVALNAVEALGGEELFERIEDTIFHEMQPNKDLVEDGMAEYDDYANRAHAVTSKILEALGRNASS